MIKNYIAILFILPVLLLTACQEEFDLDAEPPTEADAAFSMAAGSNGPNYVVFTNNSDGFIKQWDFGNGTSSNGDEVTAYFPFSGEYEVTLTVFTKGGSVASSEVITIDQTDPEICNVEIFQLLTGGCDQPEGKTWVIDADRAGHFGLGPGSASVGETFTPDWYQAAANEKIGGGLYDDEFTFFLNESVFVQETNGDVYVNSGQKDNFPGAVESPVGDYTAPYDSPENMNYSITEDGNGDQFINISQGGFIGYATGVNTYQILSISETEMFLRVKDAANADFAWYQRFIVKGFEPVAAGFTFTVTGTEATFTNTSINSTGFEWDFGDGNTSTEENPVHTYAADGNYEVTLTASGAGETSKITQTVTIAASLVALPLTFESQEPVFTTFGNSSYQYIDNPDASGINTSSRVLETVHGNETWAGLFTNLTDPIDPSATTLLSLKVWAPQTGTFRLKLENAEDDTDFIEIDQEVSTASAWVELNFDISGAIGKTYRKVVLFPGWNVADAGTFYVDDIQLKIGLPLTFEVGEPQFDVFGGSSYTYIDNPDASGINTSSRVLETVHGGETWAGLFTDLTEPLDIKGTSTITLKVWAPQTGTFRLKLENTEDSNDFVEIDQNVGTASAWVEIAFDISSAAGASYRRIVIFPGWDVANAGTFYIDDIDINE